MSRPSAWLQRTGAVATGLVAITLVGIFGSAQLATAGSLQRQVAAGSSTSTTSGSSTTSTSLGSTTTSTTTTTLPLPVQPGHCPLTGLPAPAGVVPARGAIGVKIDNYGLGPEPTGARPQLGLQAADLVYEEQVEARITRYVAILQCATPSVLIGPIRSARLADLAILAPLGGATLVHVGGIAPILSLLKSGGLSDLDLMAHANLELHPKPWVSPHDVFALSGNLYSAVTPAKTPASASPALFSYAKTAGSGTKTSSVRLNWSVYSDLTWSWSASTHSWHRNYNVSRTRTVKLQADVQADRWPVQTTNVVIQVIHYTYGPWVEDANGSLESVPQIVGNHGVAWILRDGVRQLAHWVNNGPGDRTVYTLANGKPANLQSGSTWVELYPDDRTISFR